MLTSDTLTANRSTDIAGSSLASQPEILASRAEYPLSLHKQQRCVLTVVCNQLDETSVFTLCPYNVLPSKRDCEMQFSSLEPYTLCFQGTNPCPEFRLHYE